MSVSPIPPGYHTVTPYLTVADAAAQIAFCQAAFGAEVTQKMEVPGQGVMHAELQIGSSRVMIGQARGEHTPMPSMLYLYLEDCDAAYAQALAAGGKSIHALEDQFYGDRSGAVEDPNGNQWWVASHVEDVPPQEMERRMAEQGG